MTAFFKICLSVVVVYFSGTKSSTLFAQDVNVANVVAFDSLKYKISRVDTHVIHCVLGEYGQPGFKSWDSTSLIAYIILPDFPAVYDSLRLSDYIQTITRENNWNELIAFRDEFSILLFSLSSAYANRELKKRNGYIGRFRSDLH